MDPKEYEEKIIKKLVDEFQQNFYNKVGFRPVVIINREKEKVVQNALSLDDLKKIVDSHIPEKFKNMGCTLESKHRYREIVMLRQIFCYIAKKQGYNLNPIGEKLGNRDHTTVIHSVRTASDLLGTDPVFISIYDNIIYDIVKTYGNEFALLQSVKEEWDNSQSALHPVLL
jgi:chromosomal replication initiation ATPase DnaA